MLRVLTAAQMRQAEQAAEARHGMPSALLMENAGRGLAEVARGLIGSGGRFVVVCGPGNNGGDGLVAARFLREGGACVSVVMVGDAAKLTPEARRNLEAVKGFGVTPRTLEAVEPARRGDVVVDALFGTGLSRAPAGAFADAVSAIRGWRAAGAKVVAADVPSGLQSDTGAPFSPCVEADATVAFGFLKPGQVLEPGASLCGRVHRVDIGMGGESSNEVSGPELFVVEESDARRTLPARKADSHKGTFGHVLVVAGSRGKTGAAALVAKAALRSGAGLVTVAARADALDTIQAHSAEIMGIPLEASGPLGMGDLDALVAAAEGKDALVIGPGIPRGPETGALIGELLSRVEVPAVLDADALNAVATDLSVLRRAKGPVVMTPHPGEMARLTGKSTKEVQAHRLDVARQFSVGLKVTLVLKGDRTLTSDADGRVYLNTTGNPGMATGGSGDVLSGICGAFLAQSLPVPSAIWTAVYAHGLAGDLAAEKRGQLGLVAGDIVEQGLCEVWLRWER
ncbi:bifunctional ADP-dependent (S)-NAD(P)H-hydrate dehydratase/NAD(P)H-hydrate epimerase [Myxococcus xanthus]|uniref:NAD(P)H-hydrate dehydratase n=1 Tax=Myxococcus xanthus TaxID=34 RepID=UPI0011264384|nr:NAD(P)H-hydrate dehydratase [Myxococcus xanthus]QDE91161.1 bifunctional ADP-dependent (S)-NAD(P)H-hydrate dehydratase/NAD(P)H-hydrate epimerase [Myxococcus xanthus]